MKIVHQKIICEKCRGNGCLLLSSPTDVLDGNRHLGAPDASNGKPSRLFSPWTGCNSRFTHPPALLRMTFPLLTSLQSLSFRYPAPWPVAGLYAHLKPGRSCTAGADGRITSYPIARLGPGDWLNDLGRSGLLKAAESPRWGFGNPSVAHRAITPKTLQLGLLAFLAQPWGWSCARLVEVS